MMNNVDLVRVVEPTSGEKTSTQYFLTNTNNPSLQPNTATLLASSSLYRSLIRCLSLLVSGLCCWCSWHESAAVACTEATGEYGAFHLRSA